VHRSPSGSLVAAVVAVEVETGPVKGDFDTLHSFPSGFDFRDWNAAAATNVVLVFLKRLGIHGGKCGAAILHALNADSSAAKLPTLVHP
jgi:hypothetical protein